MNIYDIRPRELLNDYLVRVGNKNGDGGYLLPAKLLTKMDVLYSYGIGQETNFEKEYKCVYNNRIEGYDHTIESTIPEINFHREGLSGYPTHNCNNFLYHLKQNKDEDKKVLLKIDVEGSEYEFIQNTNIATVAEHAPLLLLEFHNANQYLAGSLDKVKEHYNIVHWHYNNYGGLINGFPEVPEITFVSKAIDVGDYTQKTYPLPNLDKPNNGKEDGYQWKYEGFSVAG